MLINLLRIKVKPFQFKERGPPDLRFKASTHHSSSGCEKLPCPSFSLLVLHSCTPVVTQGTTHRASSVPLTSLALRLGIQGQCGEQSSYREGQPQFPFWPSAASLTSARLQTGTCQAQHG